jgi:hypothetical protein
LQLIDLRQEPLDGFPHHWTGLDDEFVLEILSTMLPHELKIVKVGKWFQTKWLSL